MPDLSSGKILVFRPLGLLNCLVDTSELNSKPQRGSRIKFFFALAMVAIAAFLAYRAIRIRINRPQFTKEILVTSDPSGAAVRINGRFLGTTPVRARQLQKGKHVILLQHHGFSPLRHQLLLPSVDLKNNRVHLQLEPLKTGDLNITTQPAGATVLLNGEERGNTPLTLEALPPGQYRLLLRRAGHEPFLKTVNIAPGQELKLSEKLQNSMLRFLQETIRAEPDNLQARGQLVHYLITKNLFAEAGQMIFETMQLQKKKKLTEPGKGGMWHWISKDFRNTTAGQEELLAAAFAKNLSQLGATDAETASALYWQLAIRSQKLKKRPGTVVALRRLFFLVGTKTTEIPSVLLIAIDEAVRGRTFQQIPIIHQAALLAGKGNPGTPGRLAALILSSLRKYNIEGSPLHQTLAPCEKSVRAALASRKIPASLRSRYQRLLARLLFVGKKYAAALDLQEQALKLAASCRDLKVKRINSWKLEKAQLLIKLERKAEALSGLKELLKTSKDQPLRNRIKVEIDELEDEKKKLLQIPQLTEKQAPVK
jgi:tetratricopeptide (TPR) repeat protein